MFFYSLPILFSDIHMVSPIECFIMVCAIVVAIYFTVPQPELSWRPEAYDSFLFRAWLGGASLLGVFWPYFIFLNACLLGADLLAKNGKITVSTWDEIHFVLLFTVAWWNVSIWRCSANTRHRLWSTLARFCTLAVLLEYALKMVIRIDYPRIYFNCEDILLDYGSCF